MPAPVGSLENAACRPESARGWGDDQKSYDALSRTERGALK
mgnify:CR=1 FL=1